MNSPVDRTRLLTSSSSEGLHSFRRANIIWRRSGGSAIEAQKIVGYSDLKITGEYTLVAPDRQSDLTRGIQERLAMASMTLGGT